MDYLTFNVREKEDCSNGLIVLKLYAGGNTATDFISKIVSVQRLI